jgi:2-methylcitrate dehydratase
MDQLCNDLARFAVSATADGLPATTAHALKRHIIDSVACALGALDEEPVRIVRDLAVAAGAIPVAGVFGSTLSTSAEFAAFANGAMIRALDFNDTYPGGHPSDGLGAIFALAQMVHCSGERVLASTFVLYEVFGALCDAVDFRERGWDQGTMLQIALACAAAPLLNLDMERTQHAIALAACEAPATRQSRAGRLSMWTGCAAPYGARNAVFLIQLAARGMTGPSRPFDGRHAFFEQVSGSFTLDLRAPDDARPAIARTLLKYLPIETNIQSAAHVASQLRGELPLEAIERVKIATFWRSFHETGSEPAKWAPDSRETADHSMPFIVATVLRDGVVTEASFAPERWGDAELHALMKRITVEHDAEMTSAYPGKMTTRIEITGRDGTLHQSAVDHPKGHPANPLSDADIAEKFNRLASQRLELPVREAMLAWLWTLERHATIDPLFVFAAGSPAC